ncbi:thioredoxin domain-containing protein [Pantoea vagans]|uniref:DsbA family protein n=1 Tax=Pantoea vagans TaxID=470934 RepID=UPI0022570C50|nr:thioredoxin domain-containing protein [Pantoea vagans]MCX3307813.1 thioredoxin domain-containing protein [Pantoea vagans]
MTINKLALAMMLLAGATSASTAIAAESAAADPAVNPLIQPDQQTASSDAPAATATHEASQQADDSGATMPSNPGSAEQPSVGAVPEASAAPVSQEAAASAPVQPQPEINQSSPVVNPSAEAASVAEKSEPQPAVTDRDATQKFAQTPAAEPPFTPEQETRIGELAKAYLLKHPELLNEVDQKLQKIQYDEQMKAMTTAAIQHQDELLNDNTVPAIGPEDAKVAVIEFFDYQCSVCARQAPIIQSLMKNNPQVRFIFKEWPIFGYRWKHSFQAAETGLRIWQQKGGDAYIKYHNALFASGHIEGALTQKDITKAASVAGASKLKSNNMLGTLSHTDILAKKTGFQGTPAMIVMPLSDATAETVTIYPGGAMEEMLQSAINKASGQAGD